jgi:hypothetical protein
MFQEAWTKEHGAGSFGFKVQGSLFSVLCPELETSNI